jgi:hypothetical protein
MGFLLYERRGPEWDQIFYHPPFCKGGCGGILKLNDHYLKGGTNKCHHMNKTVRRQ